MKLDPQLKLNATKLISWLEFETPTRDGRAINNLVDEIEKEAKHAGATAKRWDGGRNCGDVLLLTSPGRTGASSILLHGHVDTVHAVGSLTGTLKPRIEDGRLYGPGVYDMKAGVLMAFQEFKRSLANPSDYPHPLSLMIVPDEEHGSVFSRSITEEIAPNCKAALVFEPGPVTTERMGYGEYVITAHGRSAHAGVRPNDGQSAILELCHQIIALESVTDDDLGISCNVGLISGGTFSNVIPELATARVDLRFKDDHGWGLLKAHVESLVANNTDIKLQIDFILHQPPLTLQSTAPVLRAVQQAGRQIGLEIGGKACGGSSDANIMAGVGVPVVDGMGPEGNGAHTPFEYIDIESYQKKAALLRSLLTGDFFD
jgi:glutamate carboxypeptidase